MLIISACDCNIEGTEGGDTTCDENGQCNCACDVDGLKCDVCEVGHEGWPTCHGNFSFTF